MKSTLKKTTNVQDFDIDDDVINCVDIMKKFKIKSATTIHAYIKRGDLPEPVKLINRLYWSKKQLNEFFNKSI